MAHTPHPQQVSLRVQFEHFPVRSPLIRKSRLFSLPPPTKMFQFGGLPLQTEQRAEARSEVLFRYPWILDCLRLPTAYRSLPRPSSALKPSHPSHSVVPAFILFPQLESEPIHGVIAVNHLSRTVRLCPSPPNFRLGVAHY